MSELRAVNPADTEGDVALRDRLLARTTGIATLSDEELEACVSYLELLAAWNRRINLTALPLASPIPDSTLDKLVVEPLRAAQWIPDGAKWADLGSGGGSPAIPIKIARRSADLHLIESRERKCAFLRTALHRLELTPATVHCARLEQLVHEGAASGVLDLDVMTVRAVRLDIAVLDQVALTLRPGGRLVIFGERPANEGRFITESLADGLVVLRLGSAV